MNPLLDQVMGKRRVKEDVVPVIANLPRKTFRDRSRVRAEDEDDDREDLKRAIGEGRGDVIPDDAENLDDKDTATITAKMRPVKDVVQEPSHSGEKETYMAPYTALTAPDITPKALTPIDPSSIPGQQTTRFTTDELQKQAEPTTEISAPESGTDKATRAMDVLLGRQRTGSPAQNTQEFTEAGRVTTEAQAQAILGLGPSGEALLAKGVEMAPPVQTDGKAVYEAARRYM